MSTETKPKGWHSRRNETSRPHLAATERYKSSRGPISRRAMAEALLEERSKRSPEQQLALLDDRFGPNLGARKERARLIALSPPANTHNPETGEELLKAIFEKPKKKAPRAKRGRKNHG